MPSQRLPLLITTVALLLAGSSRAQLPSSNPPRQAAALGAPTAAPTYRTIAWEALVPAGWDGMKEFRKLDLAAMQDGDPRAAALLKRMREAWDRAPVNLALIGQAVRIAGYVVPLEESSDGLKEFLLVPYNGACIHTPPPPANQIVHVLPRSPVKGLRAMDTVWVSGALSYARNDSTMGVSNWSMQAAGVQLHGDGLKATPLR